MKITFGLSLDGYEPPVQDNCIGEVITGPTGFLELLETRLGLSGDWPSQPLRVIQYQKCLSDADKGKDKLFYSKSFSVDAFTAAETLLDWRDQWIEAGWDGTSSSTDSARIQGMARVEKFSRAVLGMGAADRLRAVIEALNERSPELEQVQIIDPLSAFPIAWQKILGKLTVIEQAVNKICIPAATEGSDLALLQNGLSSNTPVKFTGDGSFIIVKSMYEYNLARVIGESFSDSKAWQDESATVISGRRGSILDDGLHASNLPVSGQSDSSVWRPATQVLRLALSQLWSPMDPHRLLEFLTHPVCPVRQSLRSRLAKVVANTPGMGGNDWNEIISKVRSSAIERADGDVKAGAFVEEQVNTWLTPERFDPAKGAPTAKLAEHCAKITRWALSQVKNPNIDDAQRVSFLNAQKQAVSAVDAIDEMNRAGIESLTKIQLDRLIDQVTNIGAGRPDITAECNHVHVIRDPAAAIKSVERVVWWDFATPGLPKKLPWTPDEIKQLSQHQCCLPDIDKMLQFSAETWLRPVMAARKQLVIVMPKYSGSEVFKHHPLWDQVLMLTKDTKIPEVNLDSNLDSNFENNACSKGVIIKTEDVSHRGLPKQTRWWKLTEGELLGRRDFESYSSLDNFINKPHVWVFRYKAKLSAGSLENIAEDNRQKGNLLHHLVEYYFTSSDIDWKKVTKNELLDWVDRKFPVLLEKEGANYLLPGKKQAEEKLLSTAGAALWALTEYLRDAEVISLLVEEPVEGDFKGGKLNGSIDLLVTRADKKEAVVDLKWSGFTYRKEELEKNLQLQLATYAVMRRDAVKALPEQAYFIIEDGRMIAQNDYFFKDAEVCSPKDEYANSLTLWSEFQETWAWRRTQLDKGVIELTVEGTQVDEDSTPPKDAMQIKKPCNRFDDYVSLTGWNEEA